MVAVNEHGKPVPVTPLEPSNNDERRRHAAALVRKQMRREMDERFSALRSPAGA
jgi:acyl-CoA hydrolase